MLTYLVRVEGKLVRITFHCFHETRYTQDAVAATTAVEATLGILQEIAGLGSLRTVTIQADNGSSYNSKLFILQLWALGQNDHLRIKVTRLVHTEAGEGACSSDAYMSLHVLALICQ